MFKNIIIAGLVCIVVSLLVQNKQNVDILVSDVATAKQKLERATIYLEEVIDENFGPKEFEVEDTLDIPSLNLQKEPMIRDETFFEEVK